MNMIKFLNDDTCCKEDQGNGDNGGKNCIAEWENKFANASNEYIKKSAETDKSKETYDNSYNWRDKLDKWLDLIEKSNEKADNVVVELEFFCGQIKKVCENAECTSKALEKLLCQIKSIFDCLYTYGDGKIGLKTLIADLIKAIDCLKDVADKDKEPAIKCVKAYEEKIKMVCELQDDLLCKLIDSLKCANLIYAHICDEKYGLNFKLEKMKEEFKGDLVEEANCPSDDEDSKDYPCDPKAKKPQPTMPIECGDYYENLKKDLDIAIKKTDTFKKKWKDNKTESDNAFSEKRNLADALKAAKAAEGK